MEDLFRALMPYRSPRASGLDQTWRPPLEVYETADALVVCAEIAGMDEEQLQVVVDGAALSIRGVRPDRRHDERGCYHEAHIHYGAFAADVFVPFPVDPDQTEAEYRDGFLRIVLPRVAARTILPRRPGEIEAEEIRS
jgi:HSP20 family protein